MYDTFHANIEEKDVAGSYPQLRRRAGSCAHLGKRPQHSRCRSGALGRDFRRAAQVNYDGWLTVEAFGLALPEIAAATKIWRRMFSTEQQLASDALSFMKQHVTKRWR